LIVEYARDVIVASVESSVLLYGYRN